MFLFGSACREKHVSTPPARCIAALRTQEDSIVDDSVDPPIFHVQYAQDFLEDVLQEVVYFDRPIDGFGDCVESEEFLALTIKEAAVLEREYDDEEPKQARREDGHKKDPIELRSRGEGLGTNAQVSDCHDRDESDDDSRRCNDLGLLQWPERSAKPTESPATHGAAD